METGKKEAVIDKSETGGDEEEVVENGFVLNKRGDGSKVGSEASDDKQKPNGDFNLSAVVFEFLDFHCGQDPSFDIKPKSRTCQRSGVVVSCCCED